MALIIFGINSAQKGDRNCYCGEATAFLIGIPSFHAALLCTFVCLLKGSSDIPAETRAVSCSMCDLRSLFCCHVLEQQDDDPQELTGTWAIPSVSSAFVLILSVLWKRNDPDKCVCCLAY